MCVRWEKNKESSAFSTESILRPTNITDRGISRYIDFLLLLLSLFAYCTAVTKEEQGGDKV